MLTNSSNSLKKVKAEFPILMGNNFLNKKICKHITTEINNFQNYDDLVMSGRSRINKGSKNFKNFTLRSKNSARLYNILNNKKFYTNLLSIFEKFFVSLDLKNLKKFPFLKKNYGIQSGKKITKLYYKNLTLNLDMDFSVAEKGYVREAHRDRDTRVINFLIYLNKIPNNCGGNLEIFSLRNKKKLERFQSKSNIRKVQTIKSLPGRTIFWISLPNSIHAVSKMNTNKKRFFVYGSFSLNRKVVWKNYVKRK